MKRPDSKPLYNSRIIDTYLKFIKRNYSYININDLLNYADIKSYQVHDQGHWFTQQQINLFHEKLRQLTGNKEIAREAGRYAASPEALGTFRHYLIGFVSPAKVYELIGKAGSAITRSTSYSSKKISSTMIDLTVTLNEGAQEEPFQCENRLGWIEALTKLFNIESRKTEHPECLFKGDSVCRYIISWKESPAVIWKRLRNYTALAFAASWLLYGIIPSHFMLYTLTPIFIGAAVFLSWYAANREIKSLRSAVNSLKDSSEKLAEQNKQNYFSSLMINEIGEALSKVEKTDNILKRVMQILEKRLDFDRGIILLANRYKTRLDFKAGFGYPEEQIESIKGTTFSLDNPESKGVFVVSFKTQKPSLINDLDEIQDSFSQRSLDLARKLGVKSFVCCPIIYNKESLGILVVDNINSKRALLQSDLNMLMGIAPQIGISMHNAMLREAEARQFKSIIQVLEANMEAHKLTADPSLLDISPLEKGLDSHGQPLL